jgi:hypothetical protein
VVADRDVSDGVINRALMVQMELRCGCTKSVLLE